MKNSLFSIFSNSNILIYLACIIGFPLLGLSAAGLYFLFTSNYLLSALGIWLIFTLIAYALLWFKNRKMLSIGEKSRFQHTKNQNKHSNKISSNVGVHEGDDIDLPDILASQAHWTDDDTRIWTACNKDVQDLVKEDPSWTELPELALDQLSKVSAMYHGIDPSLENKRERLRYQFTLPEGLLVLAITSERYREIVLSHIPYAERVSVSSLLTLYDHQSEVKTGYTWITRARRVVRLWNPLAAAVGELREHLTDRLFKHLSSNVQTRLKLLLLQEVIQVGMELYSGRLKSSEAELHRFKSSTVQEDKQKLPEQIEPLRVLLIGQTNSGKSSLINAITGSLKAEIDNLPTTPSAQVFQYQLDTQFCLHLVDTEGLDGSAEVQSAIIDQAIEADIILYLVNASQPARNTDKQFFSELTSAFNEKPARRTPSVILVMTHIDQLPPRNEWSPPFDLNSDNPKAKNIGLAMKSCINHICLQEDTPTIPVCLSTSRQPYNVDAVVAYIIALQDEAILSQWNRRRIESGKQSISWGERLSQFKKLGQVLSTGKLSKS